MKYLLFTILLLLSCSTTPQYVLKKDVGVPQMFTKNIRDSIRDELNRAFQGWPTQQKFGYQFDNLPSQTRISRVQPHILQKPHLIQIKNPHMVTEAGTTIKIPQIQVAPLAPIPTHSERILPLTQSYLHSVPEIVLSKVPSPPQLELINSNPFQIPTVPQELVGNQKNSINTLNGIQYESVLTNSHATGFVTNPTLTSSSVNLNPHNLLQTIKNERVLPNTEKFIPTSSLSIINANNSLNTIIPTLEANKQVKISSQNLNNNLLNTSQFIITFPPANLDSQPALQPATNNLNYLNNNIRQPYIIPSPQINNQIAISPVDTDSPKNQTVISPSNFIVTPAITPSPSVPLPTNLTTPSQPPSSILKYQVINPINQNPQQIQIVQPIDKHQQVKISSESREQRQQLIELIRALEQLNRVNKQKLAKGNKGANKTPSSNAPNITSVNLVQNIQPSINQPIQSQTFGTNNQSNKFILLSEVLSHQPSNQQSSIVIPKNINAENVGLVLNQLSSSNTPLESTKNLISPFAIVTPPTNTLIVAPIPTLKILPSPQNHNIVVPPYQNKSIQNIIKNENSNANNKNNGNLNHNSISSTNSTSNNQQTPKNQLNREGIQLSSLLNNSSILSLLLPNNTSPINTNSIITNSNQISSNTTNNTNTKPNNTNQLPQPQKVSIQDILKSDLDSSTLNKITSLLSGIISFNNDPLSTTAQTPNSANKPTTSLINGSLIPLDSKITPEAGIRFVAAPSPSTSIPNLSITPTLPPLTPPQSNQVTIFPAQKLQSPSLALNTLNIPENIKVALNITNTTSVDSVLNKADQYFRNATLIFKRCQTASQSLNNDPSAKLAYNQCQIEYQNSKRYYDTVLEKYQQYLERRGNVNANLIVPVLENLKPLQSQNLALTQSVSMLKQKSPLSSSLKNTPEITTIPTVVSAPIIGGFLTSLNFNSIDTSQSKQPK